MGESLVQELQRLALDSNTNVRELLRRAKVVATRLDLNDAHAWIDHEIGGYHAPQDVPAYRVVPSQLEVQNPYHGWHPVDWGGTGKLQEYFSTFSVRLPIAEVVEVTSQKEGEPGFSLNQNEMAALKESNPDFGTFPSM